MIEVLDPRLQAAITEMRTAGLNIMMSMKEEGKPISFVEDCAVPLEHLADYTSRLTDIFEKHGTRGTWYAHASVGCLHVRPVLNLRLEQDVKAMRAIAEEAFDMVRAYKGSHSGEHGDGIVRSEFHEKMFGPELVRAFEEVKDSFDPDDLLQSRQDRACAEIRRPRPASVTGRTTTPRRSMRGSTGRPIPAPAAVSRARSRCATTTAPAARSRAASCARATASPATSATSPAGAPIRCASPSAGQLGPDALTSDEMARDAQALRLLQGLPARVPDRRRHGAHEDRGAGGAGRQARALAARPAGRISAALCAARRALARSRQPAQRPAAAAAMVGNICRAERAPQRCRAGAAMRGASRRVCPAPTMRAGSCSSPTPSTAISSRRTSRPRSACSPPPATACICRSPRTAEARPLCCGRTFLAVGLVDEARREAERCVAALAPLLARGMPVVGLEPSCILGFRDEIPALIKSEDARALAANALLFEEFLAREADGRHGSTCRSSRSAKRALLHGHCHQKSFGAMGAAEAVLALMPELAVETVESSCCGMAGAFGYGADTIDVSLKMAELSLLPAVRKAEADTLVLADGTSCRHQIKDGSGRDALHVARVLAMSLNPSGAGAGAWPA